MVVHSLVCHSAENGNHVAVPHANYSMLPGHRIVIVRIGCLHKMLDASLLKCLHHPRGATERHKERIKSSTLSVFQFSQAACAFLFSWYFFLISQMHLSHIFRFCMRHFHYSKDVIVALKLRCTSTADHIICMNHSFMHWMSFSQRQKQSSTINLHQQKCDRAKKNIPNPAFVLSYGRFLMSHESMEI